MRYFNIYLVSIVSILTLFLSFIFKFDISNGGSSSDLATHWTFIQKLNLDIKNLYLLESGKDYKLLHFPLHHIIFSRFDFIAQSLENYLLTFFIISLFLPILFYMNCKILFKKTENHKIILLTILIYLFPHFQASAIWGNSHLTALFFFLLSVLNLNDGIYNYKQLSKSKIFYCFLFMSLAAYTRQYYVIFFPFLIVKIFLKERLKNFLFIVTSLILLSLPGFIHLMNNPDLLFGLKRPITNFNSSIVVVTSILSFYLAPFFLSNLKLNLNQIKNILKGINLYIYFFANLILIFLCLNFSYDGTIGGGIFYKLSLLTLNNNLIFFLSSFFGLFLLFFFSNQKYDYFILILILIFSFSSGIYIFQKYFEPLMYFVFILLFDKKKVEEILKNKLDFLMIYFMVYWVIYFMYSTGKIYIY